MVLDTVLMSDIVPAASSAASTSTGRCAVSASRTTATMASVRLTGSSTEVGVVPARNAANSASSPLMRAMVLVLAAVTVYAGRIISGASEKHAEECAC
jgi:hypothetical protein